MATSDVRRGDRVSSPLPGKDRRDCEKDDRDQGNCCAGHDGEDVDGQRDTRIREPPEQRECPGQKQKADRRTFGDDECDHFAATAPLKIRFWVLG